MTIDNFAALHTSADPLVLFNIWDAGSAAVVARAGAKAIATGSLSLAGSQGFEDGEALSFDALLVTVRQIVQACELPVSVDVETGYSESAAGVRDNLAKLREAGAIGCNLEDRLIAGDGLRDVPDQCERIEAAASAGLFVNARTDLFLEPLMAGEDPNRAELVDAAIKRAAAYADAGARCFFVPGLSDTDLIERMCREVSLPINGMRLDGMPANRDLAGLGVARISYGPAPWRDAMAQVQNAAREAFA